MNVAGNGHTNKYDCQFCFAENRHLGLLALENTKAVLVCRSPTGERRPCAVSCAPWRGFGERSWCGRSLFFWPQPHTRREKS